MICDFEDGSRLILVATDRGNSVRGVQEYIDVRRGDITVSISDFVSMTVQRGGRQSTRRALRRDKGHAGLYRRFLDSVRQGTAPLYPQQDLATTCLLYMSATDAARANIPCVDLSALPLAGTGMWTEMSERRAEAKRAAL